MHVPSKAPAAGTQTAFMHDASNSADRLSSTMLPEAAGKASLEKTSCMHDAYKVNSFMYVASGGCSGANYR
eukprot:1138912-Pelagomonas_calceolata.AAC.6